MIMIKDDQTVSQSGEDPLATLRIRHLVALCTAAVLATSGSILLMIGLALEHVYMWTGGLACLLGAVGAAVYAGQLDAARLTLQQHTAAASQGEDRDARVLQFEGVIIGRLEEIVNGMARLERQQNATRIRLDAAEQRLDHVDQLGADLAGLRDRMDQIARTVNGILADELREKRQRRSG